jgi:glycine/D-amino acid oxidase-like deaminating enzyme
MKRDRTPEGRGASPYANSAVPNTFPGIRVKLVDPLYQERYGPPTFPSVGRVRIVRTWTGIEGKTDDHLPIIGASPNARGCYHAFGFSGHGFQLVPVVGAVLADLIVRGSTNRSIKGLGADRLMQQRATLTNPLAEFQANYEVWIQE